MKKAVKIVVYLLIAFVVLVGAGLSYLKFGLPDVGDAPELKVEITPQRIERGKYLANHVTVCIDCHSRRDWSRLSGPLDPANLGTGGEKFNHDMGFPGEVYSPNITPFNLKNWSDGEIFRAITQGVKKDGSAIFPLMPYKSYSKLDKEDVLSIIAYLRTLPSKETHYPKRKLDFPLSLLVNTMPVKADLQTIPNESDHLAYGAYLVNASACKDCHTKQEKGEQVPGMEFAGGMDFKMPTGTVSSANITSDKQTGIGSWTKEQFVSRFKAHENPETASPVAEGGFQTVMPWTMYGGMKTSDLEAIYDYLQTVKPVSNKVVKFTPLMAAN